MITSDLMNNEKEASDSIAYWKIWSIRAPLILPETQVTLKGYSVAALRTNFYIKELGIMLDAGLSSPNMTINHLFITHPHSDHIANLPFHIYSYKPPDKIQIYIPKGIENHVKDYIESAYLLSSHTFIEDLNIKREKLFLYDFFDLINVEPGMIIPIVIKKKKYKAEIFKCYHNVPCVGYGITEIRTKLKEEFKDKTHQEIVELRKQGIAINYEADYKLFCYLGDTSKEIFTGDEWEKITQYKTIIIECTFILDEDLDQSNKTHHIHWKSLEPEIAKYQNNFFVLIHFSQRYNNSFLDAFFKKVGLNNIVPWIN